jgi:phosphatidylinositol glycan class B
MANLLQNVRRNSGLESPHWRRFVVRWSVVSLLLIALAAHNSYGYYQFDEHYSVVEFVGFKLGRTPEAELPWEYRAQIRPWLQPGMYYVAAKALTAVGVKNPFTLSFAFRLISGLIGWLAVVSMMASASVLFGAGRLRRLAVVLLATLWLIPYLAVRTSGESLSGSFLALGAAALLLGSSAEEGRESFGFGQRRITIAALLIAGVCFGLAFEFRPQIAFAVIGVSGWMALSAFGSVPRRIGNLAVVGCGVMAMIALGVLVDRWGYGQWTLVPWNYFRTDVLQGRPSLDGTAPVWAYFGKVIINPMALVSIAWLGAMLITWIRHPRNIVACATLPFFVAHSLVPHKELRYLFPIALVATLAIPLALFKSRGSHALPAWLQSIWHSRRSFWAKALVAVNAIGLIYVCSASHAPSLNFQSFLFDRYPHGCTMYVLGADTRSPFENVGATMYFYRPENFVSKRLKDEAELANVLRSGEGDCLVVRDQLSRWSPPADTRANAERIYGTYPAWVERYNCFNWLSNSRRFSLYAVHPITMPAVAARDSISIH